MLCTYIFAFFTTIWKTPTCKKPSIVFILISLLCLSAPADQWSMLELTLLLIMKKYGHDLILTTADDSHITETEDEHCIRPFFLLA